MDDKLETYYKQVKKLKAKLDQMKKDPKAIKTATSRARNVHDIYVAGRLEEGWTYGPERNDALKTNPTLIPFNDLPESEKEYDINTALITLLPE